MQSTLPNEYVEPIKKVQDILSKIDKKIPVFFNITSFKTLNLVKENGTDSNGNTVFILTDKGNRILNTKI